MKLFFCGFLFVNDAKSIVFGSFLQKQNLFSHNSLEGAILLNLYEYEYFCAGVYVLWCHDLCTSDSVFFKSHLETSSCRINPKKMSSNDEDGSGLSHMFSISVIQLLDHMLIERDEILKKKKRWNLTDAFLVGLKMALSFSKKRHLYFFCTQYILQFY